METSTTGTPVTVYAEYDYDILYDKPSPCDRTSIKEFESSEAYAKFKDQFEKENWKVSLEEVDLSDNWNVKFN